MACYIVPMSTTTLYDALLEAGASRETARRAADGVAQADQVATKADLALLGEKVAEMETRMTWRIIGIVFAANALVFAALRAL